LVAGFYLFGAAVIGVLYFSSCFGIVFRVDFGGNGCTTFGTGGKARKGKIMAVFSRSFYSLDCSLYVLKDFFADKSFVSSFVVFVLVVKDANIESVGKHFTDLVSM
jgi:hypothetical protein